MRVLFITGEYPIMQGGVGDYTQRLSHALGELGADVHVLTAQDAGGDHLRQPATPYEPAVYPVIRSPGLDLWREALRVVDELQPDVVHVQYQAAAYRLKVAINFLPFRLRMRRRYPYIVTTFHDLLVPYLFPKAGGLRWQTVLSLANGSDAVVVTNRADWQRLAHTSLARKLRPIPIGSNIQCRPPAGYDRDRQRAAWGVQPGDWLLAYFGFLNASKGGETLMRALAELVQAGRPARLLMVGGQVGASDPTNAVYLSRVEELIRDMGLAGRVGWTGFISPEQVSANLLAADCAVLPFREGATLRHGSLMAAFVHGLAVVTTRMPDVMGNAPSAFPALQDGHTAALVSPDDPSELASAVSRIMSDPGSRARLAEGARVLSHQFTWDTIARTHLETYRSLAAR
jgi:glycosyltransferase involved in cell wall biosynthesis